MYFLRKKHCTERRKNFSLSTVKFQRSQDLRKSAFGGWNFNIFYGKEYFFAHKTKFRFIVLCPKPTPEIYLIRLGNDDRTPFCSFCMDSSIYVTPDEDGRVPKCRVLNWILLVACHSGRIFADCSLLRFNTAENSNRIMQRSSAHHSFLQPVKLSWYFWMLLWFWIVDSVSQKSLSNTSTYFQM